MAKSIETINREFCEKHGLSMAEREGKPSGAKGVLSSVVFYAVLALMLFVVVTQVHANGASHVFGYSYYNILTKSMQSTIPQGSFILVKETAGADLQVGDDITFFKNANTIVTHRIINIYPNYEGSGQYGFQTQGTDNPAPDQEITFEGNVIGKVMFHVPKLGFIMHYVSGHIVFVLIGFALILTLSFFLKIVFAPEENETGTGENGKKKGGPDPAPPGAGA